MGKFCVLSCQIVGLAWTARVMTFLCGLQVTTPDDMIVAEGFFKERGTAIDVAA